MSGKTIRALAFILLTMLFILPVDQADAAKNLIYDEAGLLSAEEVAALNALANEYGAERETDFLS